MKKSWEVKRLGEVCEIKTGKKDVNQGNPNGKFPFFTCAREHTYSDEFSFDTEALLIAGNGDVGTVSYYKGKFEAYQRTYVLLNFKNISPRFLFLILDGYLKQTVSKQKLGNTMPYIKMGMLADFKIPLPSFSEQQHIVSVLEKAFVTLEKAKENSEKNLQSNRELSESYLQSIFANSGDGLEKKRLGEVCEDVEYGTSAKSFKTGKLPVLRMGNIQGGKLNWDDLVYTSDDEEIKKYALRKNDILFNRTNSEELVGKTAIYKGERPAIFAGYLIRVNIKKDLIDADFLNICLNSKKLRDYGFSVMTSSVNQANINGSKLKEYPLILPPLSEQKRIVAKLDALSTETKRLEAIYERKLFDLEELKKSILQKALSGKLVGACS